MTRNPTSISMDRTFCFSWSPESIGKIRKCLFDRISNPLERKTFYVPPSPSEMSLLDPPTPRKFHDPPWGGGGVWIFSGTTQSQYCHTMSFFGNLIFAIIAQMFYGNHH